MLASPSVRTFALACNKVSLMLLHLASCQWRFGKVINKKEVEPYMMQSRYRFRHYPDIVFWPNLCCNEAYLMHLHLVSCQMEIWECKWAESKMSGVWYEMSGVQDEISGVQDEILGVQDEISGVYCLNARYYYEYNVTFVMYQCRFFHIRPGVWVRLVRQDETGSDAARGAELTRPGVWGWMCTTGQTRRV
jgi:hypothetical protein